MTVSHAVSDICVMVSYQKITSFSTQMWIMTTLFYSRWNPTKRLHQRTWYNAYLFVIYFYILLKDNSICNTVSSSNSDYTVGKITTVHVVLLINNTSRFYAWCWGKITI